MKRLRNKSALGKRKEPRSARSLLRSSVATVLHIDDDPNDTELFQAAVRRAEVRFLVHNVADGEQAMAYLNGRGIYSNRQLYPWPSLILLDLKMPRATGFDVLEWIRAHPEAGKLPVAVLSGSELEDDLQRAYAVGADSYLVKPIGFSALVDLVKSLDSAWVSAPAPKAGSSADGLGRGWSRQVTWANPADTGDARP